MDIEGLDSIHKVLSRKHLILLANQIKEIFIVIIMINIDRFGISTSSPLQGTSHEKNLEEACVSKVESEKGPSEKKTKKLTIYNALLTLPLFVYI